MVRIVLIFQNPSSLSDLRVLAKPKVDLVLRAGARLGGGWCSFPRGGLPVAASVASYTACARQPLLSPRLDRALGCGNRRPPGLAPRQFVRQVHPLG